VRQPKCSECVYFDQPQDSAFSALHAGYCRREPIYDPLPLESVYGGWPRLSEPRWLIIRESDYCDQYQPRVVG